MVRSESGINNMRAWIRPALYQHAVGGVMVRGIFSLVTLVTLVTVGTLPVPTDHCL